MIRSISISIIVLFSLLHSLESKAITVFDTREVLSSILDTNTLIALDNLNYLVDEKIEKEIEDDIEDENENILILFDNEIDDTVVFAYKWTPLKSIFKSFVSYPYFITEYYPFIIFLPPDFI